LNILASQPPYVAQIPCIGQRMLMSKGGSGIGTAGHD
jgi:hypothetical protein